MLLTFARTKIASRYQIVLVKINRSKPMPSVVKGSFLPDIPRHFIIS